MSGKNICDLLNIRYPLIQGGMARIATGAFAAQVSNAGGLGIIGSGSMEPKHLIAEIEICRQTLLPNRNWGVNLMLLNPFCDELVDIIIQEQVPVVTTGAGSPGAYVKRLQQAGIKVLPVVASPIMAVRMARLKVDGIIAEGSEAGGHVGSLTTMALVPQVVDAVDLPVVAAGGISDERQLAAAFALGASGVQVGTMLLASKECPIHEAYKQKVIQAKSEEVVTVGRINGTPTQLLKNKMTRAYLKLEREGADWESLERFSLGGLRRAVVDGDVLEGALMVGQTVGLVKEEKSLAEMIEQLFENLPKAFAAASERWEVST